jgi:hypothetical protein
VCSYLSIDEGVVTNYLQVSRILLFTPYHSLISSLPGCEGFSAFPLTKGHVTIPGPRKVKFRPAAKGCRIAPVAIMELVSGQMCPKKGKCTRLYACLPLFLNYTCFDFLAILQVYTGSNFFEFFWVWKLVLARGDQQWRAKDAGIARSGKEYATTCVHKVTVDEQIPEVRIQGTGACEVRCPNDARRG